MKPVDIATERRLVLGLLVQEDGIYGQLADLTQQEHEAIVAGTPEQLEVLVFKKEQLVERVLLLEAERLASVSRLAPVFEADAAEVTLSDLQEVWTGEELTQVTKLQASLQANITRMADLNKRNASLLRSSLVMLNRWMDLLIGGRRQETYSRAGGQRKRTAPVAVNRTA